MIMVVPLLVFAGTFMHFLGLGIRRQEILDWREAFLQAALACGTLLIVISEGLSLFGGLSRWWLALGWSVPLVAIFWLGCRKGSFRLAWRSLNEGAKDLERFDVALMIGFGLVSAALLLVAWVSPPNNNDSLLYHMSRVVHWAQDGSLRHYPTQYEHQLAMPIGAEVAILNLRLLWGSDRPANLVQWFSMVGSMVGASALAKRLGARRNGQLLAAAFVASIPMGVLQATSTQNDYVTAFWAICLAYFVVASMGQEMRPSRLIAIGFALGLGLVTKATFVVYAFPCLVWFLVDRVVRTGARSLIVQGIVIAGTVGLINAGYWARNVGTYGVPFGPADLLSSHVALGAAILAPPSVATATPAHDLGPAAQNPEAIPEPGTATMPTPSWPGRLFLSLGEAVAQNLGTPFSRVNEETTAVLGRVLGSGFEASLVNTFWNHEDLAGSPLHLLLVPVCLIALLVASRGSTSRLALAYAVVTLTTYLLLTIVIVPADDLYGVRLQLPFFVLWGGVAGAALSTWPRGRFAHLGAWFLLLACLPWLLFNSTRPIISRLPWVTRIGSILQVPAREVLFANNLDILEGYVLVTDVIKSSGCRQVGLRIDSHDREYPIWWLLGAPQSGIRIEAIDTDEHLDRYIDPGFMPCAVICTTCGEMTRLHGLPRSHHDFGNIALFEGVGYESGEDG